jgi:hypothetical protein
MLPIKFAIFEPGRYSTPPGSPCQWQVGDTMAYRWLGIGYGGSYGQADSAVCNMLFGTDTTRLQR